jgi:hypothetical protein
MFDDTNEGKKQKDKQWSTKHYKVKYRATRTPLNDGMNAGVPEW